ncbi:MAG TPA: hypothetical protein V6D13_19120 [Halomicronema sp.]
MDVLELKFLLELLGEPNYRAPASKIKPNPQSKATERDNICRRLAERDLVGYSVEVTRLVIAPPGKSLLKLEVAGLPVTAEELLVLQACANGEISALQSGIVAEIQQPVIQGLAQRGLIQALKTQINEVWLTERGQQYLLNECNPTGTTPVMSLNMLANYLRFFRKAMREMRGIEMAVNNAEMGKNAIDAKLSDEDILQFIKDLDRQLGTDNYLPIFQLRSKLQSALTRDELDKTLYRLQRNDKIELSSLQEAFAYSQEQIEAGIAQDVGGPLFFIIVI